MKLIISRIGFSFSINSMLLIVLLLFEFSLSTMAQKNYYISSSTGDDNNDGLTESTAWLTVSKVNDEMANFVAGDVIGFMRGNVFDNYFLDIDISGSSGNPIIFGAYGVGSKPILRNNNATTASASTITVSGDYIEIRDLSLQVNYIDEDKNTYGVAVTGNNIVVSDCYIESENITLHRATDIGYGVAIGAHNSNLVGIEIRDNTIQDIVVGIVWYSTEPYVAKGIIDGNDIIDCWSSATLEGEGIRLASDFYYTRDYEYGMTISNNYITGFGENAIDLNNCANVIVEYNIAEYPADEDIAEVGGSAGGSAIKAGGLYSYGNIVRYNTFRHLRKPVHSDEVWNGISFELGDGGWAYNNLIYDVQGNGVYSGGNATPIYPAKTKKVYNNTIDVDQYGVVAWGGTSKTTRMVIKNNIIITQGTYQPFVSYAYSTTGNNLFNNTPTYVATNTVEGDADIIDTNATDSFTDYANNDYSLSVNSVVIDGGQLVGNSGDGSDIDAWAYDTVNNRKALIDSNPDIGAFEFSKNNNFQLTYKKPIITIQPLTKTINENSAVQISVSATCDNPIEYSWYRYPWNNLTSRIIDSDTNYSGAETNTLTINNVDVATFNGQEYFCGVYNSKDRSNLWVNSQVVKLTVTSSNSFDQNLKTPVITKQPVSKIVQENENVTFTVEATCDNEIGYQWWKSPFVNDTESKIVNNLKYSGAQTNILTIKEVQITDADISYVCEVFNKSDRTALKINTDIAGLTVNVGDKTSELKVLLEGPFNNNGMQSSLVEKKFLPETQPYNISPYNYFGTQEIMTFSKNIIDWILIELRSDKNTREIQFAALLRNDGIIINDSGTQNFTNYNISDGNYFLVIHHRNHLSIMSKNEILVKNSILKYDFSTGLNKAYGTNSMAELENGSFAMYSGDSDANKVVNKLDFGSVANYIFTTGYQKGDIDMNGLINVLDYSNINKNISIKSNVP